jgi:hypothetical protein
MDWPSRDERDTIRSSLCCFQPLTLNSSCMAIIPMPYTSMLDITALASLLITWAVVQQSSPKGYISRAGYKNCLDCCQITGSHPQNWIGFSNIGIFLACKSKSKLFGLALYTLLEIIRSCSSITNEMVGQRARGHPSFCQRFQCHQYHRSSWNIRPRSCLYNAAKFSEKFAHKAR